MDHALRRLLSVENLTLLFLLGIAAGLRLYCVQTNLPDYPAVDEPQIVERALRVGGGDLNPHFFNWPGSLLIYANTCVFAVYYIAGVLFGWFDSLRDFQRMFQQDATVFYVLARLVDVFAALATVWLLFRSTRQFGLLAGATAAMLTAVSPLHVRESAIAYTDVPAALFLLGAVIAAKSFVEKPFTVTLFASGVLLGLGAAVKYYVVVAAFGITCAAMLRHTNKAQLVRLLAVAASGAALGFVIGCPFSILAFREFSRDLLKQIHHQSTGHIGFEPESSPVLWYLRTAVVPGIGLPALIAACVGAFAIVRHHRGFLPLLVTAIAYGAFASATSVSFQRYAIPHVVLLSVCAAAAVWQFRNVPWLPWVSAALIVAIPAAGAVGVVTDRAKEDARAAAARWLQSNVPASARVLASADGPRFRSTQTVSSSRPVTPEQLAAVEQGGFDVFVLTWSTTTLMESKSARQHYPDIANSHLRLYRWVKEHARMEAVFRPGPNYNGTSVEIYVMPDAPKI